MLDIEETYVYDNYVYFVKFGKNKGGVDVMKRKLKLMALCRRRSCHRRSAWCCCWLGSRLCWN